MVYGWPPTKYALFKSNRASCVNCQYFDTFWRLFWSHKYQFHCFHSFNPWSDKTWLNHIWMFSPFHGISIFSQFPSPLFHSHNYFWTRKSFFASSIKLLSCCCSWANRVSFEHGWSYRKNSNAGKFVFPYWFIHKNFRLVRGPVFCPVSGFCTSDGPIEKIFM